MKVYFAASLWILYLTACARAPIVHTTPATSAPAATIAPSQRTSETTTGIPPSRNEAAITLADNPLVIYHTAGGIAGMDETLTVHKDGKLELVDARRNYHSETRIQPERIVKLRELISKPEYNNLQLSYLAHGADLFTYHITTWTSDGQAHMVTTMDTAAHPDILSQVIFELNALRRLIP
jgi:hypothetical protein